MTPALRIQVGLRLKEVRLKRGLTLKQEAELIGTTESQLSKIENGSYSISVDKLEIILDKLKLKLMLKE